MIRPANALRLGCFWGVAAFAQPPKPTEETVPLPSIEVSSSSLELGAQFNPFVNSLTKKVSYINVSRLKEGSVAARGGLQNGDHIIEVNGVRLSDYRISEVPKLQVVAVDHQASLILKVRRKTSSDPIEVILTFREFDGRIVWDISRSTLQKSKPSDNDGRKN